MQEMKHTEKKQTYKTNTANSCDKKGKKNGLNVLIQNEGKTGSEENQVQKFTSQQKTHKHKQGKTYKMRKFHPTKQKQKSFFFATNVLVWGLENVGKNRGDCATRYLKYEIQKDYKECKKSKLLLLL